MESKCIEWQGHISAKGYGRQGVALAHRLAWERVHGPIPEGLEIDHLCRNRACVNVEHLEVVTHKENVRRGSRAQKTHCLNGHFYDEANTIRNGKGFRECRKCHNERRHKS